MKTTRELLFTIACKISGGQGASLLKTLGQQSPFDAVLDRPISDKEFDLQLKEIKKNWPTASEQTGSGPGDKPGSWGLPN